MSAALLGFLLALVTTTCVVVLAISDPKRRGEHRSSLQSVRPLAALAAALPGVVLLLMGLGVAFLIWLGSAAVLGWIVAALFSYRYSEKRGR
jgi:hypothetical protein